MPQVWPSALQVAVDRRDGEVRVELTGELDLAVVGYADAAIESALGGQPPRVVVDLSGLTFLDAVGVRALLAAAGEVELVGAHGPVRRLFALVGREDALS